MFHIINIKCICIVLILIKAKSKNTHLDDSEQKQLIGNFFSIFSIHGILNKIKVKP